MTAPDRTRRPRHLARSAVLVATVLVAVAFLVKLRLEEDWMIETFGDRYRRYRAEVRALVPFIL